MLIRALDWIAGRRRPVRLHEQSMTARADERKAPPWIVNVGLPRTGTASFAAAVRLLDLNPLHIWNEAEKNPKLLRKAKANHPNCREFMAQYHAVSDTPFYAMRETFERFYPNALILYTTRDRDEWVESMIAHRRAGGRFLANLYGLSGVPPYATSHQAMLARMYDRHHAEVCVGLPSIDIGDQNDHVKWELLCSALPNPAEAMAKVAHRTWPHRNRLRSEPLRKPDEPNTC